MGELPKIDINVQELVKAIEDELQVARDLPPSENFGAVNWGDLGVADVECRVSLLYPETPSIVVTVEEASPDCRLAEWLNERMSGRFPGVWIVCEW
jgi:hypothetical protein